MKKILKLVLFLGVYLTLACSASFAAPTLLSNDTWWNPTTTIEKNMITEINIVDSYTATGDEDDSWKADVDVTGSIMCYIEGTVLTIAGDGTNSITANADSSYLFAGFEGVERINGLTYLDTSNVTNMREIFSNCSALTELDLSNFNTTNVENMMGMFNGCSNITSLDITGFNTENVTIMASMFDSCTSLSELDFSNFSTANVTEMTTMFLGCSSLIELDLSNFNTSKVTDMMGMFFECSNLETLDLNSFDTSSIVYMSNMFSGTNKLSEITLGENFIFAVDVSESCYLPTPSDEYITGADGYWYIDSGGKFSAEQIATDHNLLTTYYAVGYTITTSISGEGQIGPELSVPEGVTVGTPIIANDDYHIAEILVDGQAVEITNRKTMQYQFPNIAADHTISATIEACSGGNATTTQRAICSVCGYEYGELEVQTYTLTYNANGGTGAPSSQVCQQGESITISSIEPTLVDNTFKEWNTISDGSGTSYMPGEMITITQNETLYAIWNNNTIPVLLPNSTWYKGTTDKGTITSINIVDSYTQTGSVDEYWAANKNGTGIITCYVEGTKLTIVGNGSGKIIANEDSSNMFKDFTSLVTITGLSMLDTSNVTNMTSMFSGCNSITELDLSNFNTSKVTNMRYMFYYCSNLESITFGGLFDTSSVTDMTSMFSTCGLRSIDLSKFNTSSVTQMESMFFNCDNLESIDLSSFDTSNVENMYHMLSYCDNLKKINLSSFSTMNANSMTYMFVRLYRLEEITIGENFNFKRSSGTCVLPTPSDEYIPGADGYWYLADGTAYTADQIAENHNSLTTYYAVAPTFEITATAGVGGTISPSGTVSVAIGSNPVFTIVATNGYAIEDVLVDGESQGAITSYTFNDVTEAHTIEATFVVIEHECDNVGATCTTPGTCSICGSTGSMLTKTCSTCGGTGYVAEGICSVCEGTGEEIEHSWVDATCEVAKTCSECGETSGNKLEHDYTQGEVICNVNGSTDKVKCVRYGTGGCTASEERECVHEHEITVTCGSNGTITPTTITLKAGASQKFTITPSKGYEVEDVIINGGALGPMASYTFNKITQAHTIGATFVAIEHECDNAGATCIEAGVCSICGTSGEALGHEYEGEVICNVNGSTDAVKCVRYGIDGCTASEERECVHEHEITVISGSNGSISPTSAVVKAGGSVEFTITANENYEIKEVKVDGESKGAITSYIFDDVTEAHIIEATFVVKEHECDNAGATCTEAGVCSICGTSGEELGHDWADATCDVPKTCRECGTTDGESLGHDWVDATCDVAKTCKECGETEGEVLGHSWVDATCEIAKTCRECGATEGEALGHEYTGERTCNLNGSTDTVKCVRCDSTEEQDCTHIFTIIYDANGGENVPDSQTKMNGIDLVLSAAVPTRSGYTFVEWNTVNDGTGTSYSKGAIYSENSDTTLYATWKKKKVYADTPVEEKYTISVTSNNGGSISPKGEVIVTEGNDKEFNITVNDGYEIEDVLIDGKSVGVVASYTFSNVKENHSIEVIFKEKEIVLPKTKNNIIFIMGKADNFEEISLPVNELLKVYNIDGKIICDSNKATYISNDKTIVFENNKLNITVNNEAKVLLRGAKIINNTLYITLTDFLNLL